MYIILYLVGRGRRKGQGKAQEEEEGAGGGVRGRGGGRDNGRQALHLPNYFALPSFLYSSVLLLLISSAAFP